ncbi:DNA primase family protein [Noviherbaspirillum sp.]|uniref:DNA primase family protein n=1 Tax=Noviherbaspirillum sp. TaxID=1926288 RepID=UPI002FE3E15E
MITINQYNRVEEKKPFKVDRDIDAKAFRLLVGSWDHEVRNDKETAPIFTMCNYGRMRNRTKANIVSVTGIVLDVDDGNPNKQVEDALARLEPYAFFWYTTYQATPANLRSRIVVPISIPVTAQAYEKDMLALRLANWLGLAFDDCSEKATQFYFLPTKRTKDSFADTYINESDVLFDIGILPRVVTRPEKRKDGSAAGDQVAIYSAVDQLVTTMFGGVAPMFTAERIHAYSGGVWQSIDPDRSFCRQIIEHHERKISIPQAMDLMHAMKVMFSCDRFPDAATNKITLTNGTLNTDTGELEPHSHENYHRSGMPFAYDPEAKCVLFLKTLDDIFLGDDDKEMKIMKLQEWTGCLLTPMVKFQVMMWLYGAGANGKSLIMHVIRALLGAQNVCSIPLSQLGARFIGAELEGKLANIVDEIATNALMQEEELKKIISSDPILVERKGKDPYFFSPTARIMAATNTLPPSKDSTHGLDRRLMILTFNRTFKPEEMDRDLVAKLVQELPGIFVWALGGMLRLKAQDKFTVPPSSLAAMEDFKSCRNSVALFKRDCLELPGANLTLVGGSNQSFRFPSHDLYRTYKTYCVANTYQAFGKEGFGKKLKELGVEQIRTGGKRYYVAKVVNLEEAGLSDDRRPGPTMVPFSSIDDDLEAA